ncbi:MAG: sulfatase-like hydrolase/transferase [Deltaproteobacteria bacterium]
MTAFFFRRRRGTADSPVPAVSRAALPPRPVWLEFLDLVVLTTFAVTQPVFDRLGERPAFLSDSGVGLPGVLLLTATLALVVPGAVAGLVCAIGRLAPRWHVSVYAIAVFVLAVVMALPAVKRISFLPPWLAISMALGLGAGATWSYFAFRRFRSLFTAAAPAVAVFPAVFLFHSPVSALLSPPLKIQADRWNAVPVVLVVFDEFRSTTLLNERREIDAERFPHFAELARGATWFRNATTVSPDTGLAVPALLSGKYPACNTVPLPGDLPQNLFSILEATEAYEMAVFEPVSRLASLRAENHAASAKRPVLSQLAAIVPTLARVYLVHLAPVDLQRYLPDIPRLWFGLSELRPVDPSKRRGLFRYNWGADRSGQFNHFLDCLEDSPRPGLHFLHVLLPHVPWCYLPSGRKYLADGRQWELLNFDTHSDVSDFWGTDDLYVVQSQQRQILQLQFVDRLVGRLLARLRETELYEKCLLVVTADHGISFRSNEARRRMTSGNVADIMPVPLFIKTPGQGSGAISDRNAEIIDILPTIADVLGIELKLPVDGRSLLETTSPDRAEKKIFAPDGLESVPLSIPQSSRERNEVPSRFGPAGEPDALYRIGPHPQLVGRSVENLTIDDREPVEIDLVRSDTFYSPDPQTLVPCYFEGNVSAPARFEAPIPIAVAVNGTIRAVTRTYQLDGVRDRWSAMVPEWALREGINDVQFFTISGTAPNLRLTHCVVKPRL